MTIPIVLHIAIYLKLDNWIIKEDAHMDIVEYVEATFDIKLLEYQKTFLRAAYDEYKNTGSIQISLTSRRSCIAAYYEYLKQHNLPICKELTQIGKTLDSNN